MMTDPIADFLARIRNAHMSSHVKTKCPASKTKERMAEILKEEGYISDYAVEGDVPHKTLTLTLKYDKGDRPMIEGLKRVSRPGLRIYKGSTELPQVRGGLGMAVVSTSRGIMTDQAARKANVGGEVLCYIW